VPVNRLGFSEGWLFSGKSPAFFNGESGCFCCPASATNSYHTTWGNNSSGSPITNNDEWSGGAWTARTAGVAPSRYSAAAGFTENSTVYFAGGTGTASPFVYSDNDQYASGGDAWTGKTDLPTPARQRGGAVGISDIYVIGGEDLAGMYLQDCDAYAIAGNSWTNKTDMPTPAREHNACSTDGTYAHSFAGASSASPFLLRDNDQYSPAGNSWTSKTDLPTPARFCGAFTLSGIAYCTGSSSPVTTDNDAYTYASDTWAASTDIPSPARQWHGSAAVTSAAAGWITGGQNSSGVRLLDHDEFTPSAWTSRSDLPSTSRMWNASSSC
jgi:N-acetylneuraminic acid mutarotase